MLKFYHAPWSRSSSVLWLLEELAVPYEIEMVDIRAKEGVPETYRAIQPNKKVPAIEHDGVVVTERAAITVYLADRFAEAGLAPALTDPHRAAYLTTLVYCDSVFDPAICAHIQGLEYTGNQYPFGLFEDMVAYVERRLTAHPFAAGDRFTAADTQLASGINFTMNVLHALPERPVFKEYVARIETRPAYRRAQEKDMAMAAQVPFFAGAS
ncbi:glutathione S-transferase family protein [Nitratireductor sp. ZSWI3]|uniref:glutathione S-transferase family protein n=1 Tax=Nitratireductor sp. ZSWI3 TaxID=2966359 RepID=UPI00214FB93F|nr:glutathione S-transferase family protein [Nitratireductor sp. ZSWI3]MCR4267392.1 glutathione S-transferase family protein [Nitratireductor sp. ZSWI3]